MHSLRVVSVSKRRTRDEPPIFNDFSLEIKPGEILGLTGPSGCGKSTLARILVGLDNEIDGAVFLGEDRIGSASPQFQLVSRALPLFPWMSVKDNINLPFKVCADRHARPDVEEIISNLELAPLLYFSPLQLSSGQIQRVLMARALAANPKILILDEATGALDESGRIRLLNFITRRIQEENSVLIVISHSVAELLVHCERIVVLSQGSNGTAVVFDEISPARTNEQRVALVAGDLSGFSARVWKSVLAPAR